MRGVDLKESAATYAARSKEGIVNALRDARAARLAVPRREDHAHRLLFGFVVPMTLLRITWSDAPARDSMLRRLTAPVLCLTLATVVSVGSIAEKSSKHHAPVAAVDDDDDSDDDEDGDDDEVAAPATPPAVGATGTVGALGTNAAKEASETNEEHQKNETGDDHGKRAAKAKDKDDDDEDLESAEKELPPAAVAAIEQAKVAAAEAREKARTIKAQKKRKPAPPPPTGPLATLKAAWRLLTSRVVKILAALGVVEWILIWIGREHHDQLAYEISVLTGVPGEALAAPPKLRLDLNWLWLKTWRTVRFFLFLALVSPFAWALGHVPVVGPALSVVIEAAWGAYWACVFAVANTFLAWEPRPEGEPPPWFIRAVRAGGRVPLLGGIFRLYDRLLTFATRKVWPACLAFEEATWESAGLAIARAVASVPFVYVIFRPIFGPAATHALLGRRHAEGHDHLLEGHAPAGGVPHPSSLSD